MTDAYNLPCKKIIHTVGPVYKDGKHNENEMLKNCYVSSIELAENYRKENNLEEITIAFPCISTGIYHFPKKEASLIAINTVKEINNPNIKVIFVCFEEEDYKLYSMELQS